MKGAGAVLSGRVDHSAYWAAGEQVWDTTVQHFQPFEAVGFLSAKVVQKIYF